MPKHHIVVWLCCLGLVASFHVAAQRKLPQDPSPEEEVHKSLTSFGVNTNTNSGLLGGVVYRHSSLLPKTIQGKRQYRYLAVELLNVKHPKEISSQNFITGSRFTFAKQNYFFTLRPEYGREILFFNRLGDEGIAISGILAAGPSIGLEKPYMVRFQRRPGEITNEPYDPVVHGQADLIVGSAGFFSGFDRTKIIPGLHVKGALCFELSAFRESMTGVEIGFVAETFTREPVIMAFAQNRSLFTSGYITLFFGTKK